MREGDDLMILFPIFEYQVVGIMLHHIMPQQQSTIEGELLVSGDKVFILPLHLHFLGKHQHNIKQF